MNDARNDALPIGTNLQNGAFVLGEIIGRGGSGFTYRARDTSLQRDVAVKEFFPFGSARVGNWVQSQDIEYSIARAAFVEEARNLARFAHRNIVHVFGVWEENGTAYLVTEFLRGQTLREVVETRGLLSQNEALKLIEPVCGAVETVHRNGLLHGDIKPDNIILCDDENGRSQNASSANASSANASSANASSASASSVNAIFPNASVARVVLLDFGLTRPAPSGAYHTTLLVPQSAQGTSGYAPLEQYSRSARTGTWSDVYALSATLWHLLTGSPPPDAPDRASGTALPDLRRINPTVSAHIEHVLHTGLAMDVLARPQSAAEWWNLLQQNAPFPATSIEAPSFRRDEISSTRNAPPKSSQMPSTRPSVHDENTVGMLIVMSVVLFIAFFIVMAQHF